MGSPHAFVLIRLTDLVQLEYFYNRDYMNLQEEIKINKTVKLIIHYLNEVPGLQYTHTLNSITVPTTNRQGFVVKFELQDTDKYLVSYGQWQRKFINEGEAVFFFLKGLTPACRLKIVNSSSEGITHIAEHHSDRTWHSEGAKTILKKRKILLEQEQVRFLQNKHINEVLI